MKSKDFQKDLEFIRTHLKKMEIPEPSHDFLEKTRNLCHQKLSSSIKSSRIPKSIWITLVLNIIFMGFLMFFFAKALKSGQIFSPQAVGVMILVIQNAVMLFFSPVIIKKFKQGQKIGSHALVT